MAMSGADLATAAESELADLEQPGDDGYLSCGSARAGEAIRLPELFGPALDPARLLDEARQPGQRLGTGTHISEEVSSSERIRPAAYTVIRYDDRTGR